VFNEVRRGELLSDEFLSRASRTDPFEFLESAFARATRRDAVTAASLVDLVTYLPCDLMTKVDIASMANSLECRAPFLDYRLVELAAAMPIEYKLHRGRSKRVLREAFPDLLPQSVTRRPKMGFGVPLAEWFRRDIKDYSRAILLDSRTLDRGYFRREALRRLLDEHAAGQFDHSHRLWSLLCLELWHRQWLDAHSSQPAASTAAAV
jgi:asparagine synthase (glutamine-hydrolysing)